MGYIRRVESVFEVIAEPNRRAILSLLVSSQQSVGEIERRLRMPQTAVSKHLRVLRDAGIVESTVDAQRRLYRLKPEPLQEVDAWLQSNGFSTTDDAEHHEVLTKLGTAKIAVFLTDCDSQRCQSLQFFYGLSYPNGVRPDDGSAAVLVNGWNRHFRWTKAWVNELRYPVLEMDVSLSPGVDKDALNHSLITYVQSITLFNYYLNANKGS